MGALIFFLFFPNLECESSGAAFFRFHLKTKHKIIFTRNVHKENLLQVVLLKKVGDMVS